MDIQKASKAEGLAKQAVSNYLEMCNPLVPGETQQYLNKLIGVAQRYVESLDQRRKARENGQS